MKQAKLHTVLVSDRRTPRRRNTENLAPTSPHHCVSTSLRHALPLTATWYQWFLAGLLMVVMGCNSSPTSSTSETPTSSSSSVASQPTDASPIPSVSPANPAAFTPAAPASSPPASSPVTSQPTEASQPSSSTVSTQLSPPASADFTISANSIGAARVGMTLGQLKQLLAGKAEFTVKSPFIVDFDAIAVSQGGTDQYYILYPAGSPLADSDIIEALVTDNPNYRTAEGVGAGTLLEQAEAVYGDATLSYNTALESREYVKFAKHPSEAISFRIKPSQEQPLVGIYPSSNTELKQTKEFQKMATIGFVEVYCRQNCPLPTR
jgi:hypothetical protein